MYFLKKALAATIFVFSLQTTPVVGQSASIVRSYIKTELKIAQNLNPLNIVSQVNFLTRAVKLADGQFKDKLPRFNEEDTKEIEKEFLSFADEAIDALATFTKKTRPMANAGETFQKALKPFVGLESSLKTYLSQLLDTIPGASESVIVSIQLLQDSVGGVVLLFQNAGEGATRAHEEGSNIVIDSYKRSKTVKIIIE
ncbi:hypothetical protein TWF718_007946 [Orbilia javanica]|uniref:Uncharacterized protein n=1 Tax=Orbilia javanica TaxID=47235 RepID=A0AAN8N3Y3_9PEZI